MPSILRFESRDLATVEETWRQFVPSAVLEKVDPRQFRFDWFSAELPGLSIVRYELAAQVQSVVAPEDQILACRVEAARVRLVGGRTDLNDAQPWVTDGQRISANWNRSARVSALIFERATAERLARQITGDDGLRLRVMGTTAISREHGEHWDRSFSHIVASMAAIHDDPLVAAEARRQALWTTLTTFATSFRDAMSRPAQTRAAPATVRRALDYIDENAHLPITVDDVAAAVYMSTRGLQYAFRRALDTTPTARLRRARLEGAHREIRSGALDTIADIARRWGFSHPSRFAAAYREAFGELPGARSTRGRS